MYRLQRLFGGALFVLLGATLTSTSANATASRPLLAAGERAFARHDYVKAFAYLLPHAENGRKIAETYVGYMYENGLGVTKDYVLAARWLERAADQGEPSAQFLLGDLYDRGLGVWLSLATAHADAGKRQFWSLMRDAVASKLTLGELAEAQMRASEWVPNTQP